jgi:hypothetical protein
MKVTKSFDSLLVMKDAGLVAASAAATVSSAAKIIDLGSGIVEADVVIDVTACEVASRDESYRIAIQASSTSDFSDDVYELENIQLGAADYDLVTHINRLSGYTLVYDTPVAGTAGPTAGYATITNSEASLVGATVPALPSATYKIDMSIDSTNYTLSVALLVTDDWTGIAAKLQTALRTATSSTETVAISGGKIKVTSATTGITSLVALAKGSRTSTAIFGNYDMTLGRYVINFRNVIAENVAKRYVRLYTHVAGTIASGINYKAYLSKRSV